jgi:hypothetical protein
MKKLYLLLASLFLLSFTSCSLFDDLTEKDNELGGDTDIPLNQVGNTFTTTANVNGTYISANSSIAITENSDGVVKVAISANLDSIPGLSKFTDLIPDEYKDSQGNINVTAQGKITSEGYLDYTNADEAPFTMVKYDCKVGDTYKLKKSDGNTITRTVTQKSTDDDFSWGFYLIKVMTVEQDSRIPGISKIIYKFNHKFGLVYAEVVAEDGSSVGTLVYPSNY